MQRAKTYKKISRATSLIVQPDEGVQPILDAIRGAKTSVDILIFRFDRKEVEEALIDAVSRGVVVRALIAWTNRGGERNLRDLEARLLAAGVLVARTANDLVRYHGKMLIVDKTRVYILGFNYTKLDIDRSRSFGIVTTKSQFVEEAVRLFEADSTRQPYQPSCDLFLVSPLNSRERLAAFLKGARKSLDIYDPGLRDREMVRLLDERANNGVKIRILGKFRRGAVDIPHLPLSTPRLHARVIVRDESHVFIGSQSLRAVELDGRREIGIIVSDRTICRAVSEVFAKDWKAMSEKPAQVVEEIPGDKLAKKVAKAVTRELPPVAEVVESVAAEMTGRKIDLAVDSEQLEETVKEAVKTAVKEVIEEVSMSAAMIHYS